MPQDAVDRVAALADGNPFVALELSRCASAPGARLPASVAEAITDRLCDASPAALDLLRRLALTHDDFDAATAAALAPAGEAQAFAVLDAALASGTLRIDDARYRFRHELVRQALVDQVPPHRRLELHRELAARLSELDVPPALVARHWLAAGSVREAMPWLLAAARDALRFVAFSDALRHVDPVLAHDGRHAEALRIRAEALDALGDPRSVAAYRAAADADAGPLADDLRVKAALAQIKQGDPRGGVSALAGLSPRTAEGRLSEALAYSGAAALGAVDPAIGSAKSAEARRLAIASGDAAALVIASWAHAAAAHARGELHRSVHADLRDTRQLPHLAVRVFDGQLCMVQRFLYGARPYPQVIEFAQGLADDARRLGSVRGEAFGVTIRGEAELLSGDLDAAERDLHRGVDLHRSIGALTGESFALHGWPKRRSAGGGSARRANCSTSRSTWRGRPTSASTCSTGSTARASRSRTSRARAAVRSTKPSRRSAGRWRPARDAGSRSRFPPRSRPPAPVTRSGRRSSRNRAPTSRTWSCGCPRGTRRTRGGQGARRAGCGARRRSTSRRTSGGGGRLPRSGPRAGRRPLRPGGCRPRRVTAGPSPCGAAPASRRPFRRNAQAGKRVNTGSAGFTGPGVTTSNCIWKSSSIANSASTQDASPSHASAPSAIACAAVVRFISSCSSTARVVATAAAAPAGARPSTCVSVLCAEPLREALAGVGQVPSRRRTPGPRPVPGSTAPRRSRTASPSAPPRAGPAAGSAGEAA